MSRSGCLHQGDYVCVHSAQDSDMEDLVRASPDIESTRRKALWNSELQCLVRLFGKIEGTTVKMIADIPRTFQLHNHRKSALADTISSPSTSTCTQVRIAELHVALE
jgi:hypothetical protein